MNETYFDIMPHSCGWICMVDGRRQHARYASFHEAETAGRRFAASSDTGRNVVLRKQDVDGRFTRLTEPRRLRAVE